MTSKNIITTIAFAFSGAIFASCSTPAEKVNQAESNVAEANQQLENANKEYEADIAKYKIETDDKIAANQKSIADFNARIANEKAATKEAYQKKLAELEQKESDLKKKMDEYKMDGKENWIIFKTEFNRDMDELGKALKDLTVKNTGQ
jgi:outer membrane murein-binding lipoprotein Lpp